MKICQNAPKFHDESSNLLKTTEIRKILIQMGGGTYLKHGNPKRNEFEQRAESDFRVHNA